MNHLEFYSQQNLGPHIVAADRRRSSRERACLPGKIITGAAGRPVDCTIVDISATGARLAIPPESCIDAKGRNVLPSKICLVFDGKCTNVDCIKVWCTTNEVGVQFCSMFRTGTLEGRSAA